MSKTLLSVWRAGELQSQQSLAGEDLCPPVQASAHSACCLRFGVFPLPEVWSNYGPICMLKLRRKMPLQWAHIRKPFSLAHILPSTDPPKVMWFCGRDLPLGYQPKQGQSRASKTSFNNEQQRVKSTEDVGLPVLWQRKGWGLSANGARRWRQRSFRILFLKGVFMGLLSCGCRLPQRRIGWKHLYQSFLLRRYQKYAFLIPLMVLATFQAKEVAFRFHHTSHAHLQPCFYMTNAEGG